MSTKLPGEMSANPDVILTEMKDGTGVLLDMRTKFYYTLNETGVFTWKAIQNASARNVDSLTAAIVEEFEVEPDTARTDLETMLGELVGEGLLRG